MVCSTGGAVVQVALRCSWSVVQVVLWCRWRCGTGGTCGAVVQVAQVVLWYRGCSGTGGAVV